MIDLYYWPTPNGWKISIALEEMELPYEVIPVNIGRGEQFDPAFLAISPNNRMPAIADMACWPWIVPHDRQGVSMGDFPNAGRWYEKMKTRPALQRGFDVCKELRRGAGMDAKAKEILFGHQRTAKG